MENWGLITYRESRLLYDPLKSSQSSEQAIVEVIAHELAHMWFGNLGIKFFISIIFGSLFVIKYY